MLSRAHRSEPKALTKALTKTQPNPPPLSENHTLHYCGVQKKLNRREHKRNTHSTTAGSRKK